MVRGSYNFPLQRAPLSDPICSSRHGKTEEEGITPLQRVYIEKCAQCRPSMTPRKHVLQNLGSGELIWNFKSCDISESALIGSLLKTEEAFQDLTSVVLKNSEMEKKTRKLSTHKWNSQQRRTHGDDDSGEVVLFRDLCSSLSELHGMKSLEIINLNVPFSKKMRGITHLTNGIKKNQNLQRLVFSSVNLSETSLLGPLCEALGGHGKLAVLQIINCGIKGRDGGSALASIIKEHSNRRNYAMWSTGLRKSSYHECSCIRAPSSVTLQGLLVCDFSDNPLGDTGALEIAKGLQGDSWLIGLSLTATGMSSYGARNLSSCLSYNSTLCVLAMGQDALIHDHEVRKLQERLNGRPAPNGLLEQKHVLDILTRWGYDAVEKEDKVELVGRQRGQAIATKAKAKKVIRQNGLERSNSDSIQNKNRNQSCMTPKSRGVSSKMVRSGQKRDNKDDNKLAYTKRKTHGSDTIKAAGGGEGTILLKNQIAYDHNTTRSNRKRPIKMENSTDATLNYLESMVQELMRLLSMVESAIGEGTCKIPRNLDDDDASGQSQQSPGQR